MMPLARSASTDVRSQAENIRPSDTDSSREWSVWFPSQDFVLASLCIVVRICFNHAHQFGAWLTRQVGRAAWDIVRKELVRCTQIVLMQPKFVAHLVV